MTTKGCFFFLLSLGCVFVYFKISMLRHLSHLSVFSSVLRMRPIVLYFLSVIVLYILFVNKLLIRSLLPLLFIRSCCRLICYKCVDLTAVVSPFSSRFSKYKIAPCPHLNWACPKRLLLGVFSNDLLDGMGNFVHLF